jgi:hypothetical protein
MADNPIICYSCEKRKTCSFANELDRALTGLGAFVSNESRTQIREIVAKDITCSNYQKT